MRETEKKNEVNGVGRFGFGGGGGGVIFKPTINWRQDVYGQSWFKRLVLGYFSGGPVLFEHRNYAKQKWGGGADHMLLQKK